MQRRPPFYRVFDDGDIDGAHHCYQCTGAASQHRIIYGFAQSKDPHEQKQHHQGGHRASVPFPVCAPGGFTPHAAAEQGQGRERHSQG